MLDNVSNSETCGNIGDAAAVSHFWISSYPYFSTALFVLPSPALQQPGTRSLTLLTLYDADGAVINEAKLQFPQGGLGYIDLELLLGSCKLESGMKHAHLCLRSPAGTKHACRISSGNRSAALGEPLLIGPSRSAFLPITFSEETTSFAAFINHGAEEARVKCRLYAGTKNAEVELTIPGFGARVINLESEYPDNAELAEGEKRHAYLRIACRSEGVLGVQLLERYASAGGEEYRTLC